MNKDLRVSRKLKVWLLLPVITAALLLAADAWLFTVDITAGAVCAAVLIIYIIAAVILYFREQSLLLSQVANTAAHHSFAQNELLNELSTPYAILTEDGKVVWGNRKFLEIFGKDAKDKYLSAYIKELNRAVFPKESGEKKEISASYGGRDYEVGVSVIKNQGEDSGDFDTAKNTTGADMVACAFTDVTEVNRLIKANDAEKLVTGLIYIDNYDEVMGSVEEVRQSLLIALIDRKINQYIGGLDGLVKKMEKDKYFFVMKMSAFSNMQSGKFSVLGDAKAVNIGNTIPVTLSIGVGLPSETYAQSYNYARSAIDMALARGGDQAVIKSAAGINFYGGTSRQQSRNTRVKARVKAEALREFILTKDQVIVTGHKIADADSFGAAVGIWRAARLLEKKACIVIDDVTMAVRPLYDAFRESGAYPENMFIRSQEAEAIVNNNTMVVVVDTNKPEITQCPQLLKKTKTIVVFDHHRQGKSIIENAVLSYIEPYASSTAEMVSEMLQYFDSDMKISALEANSMYAGIMIDTCNFTNRTGVRTFEAAAFLRRCGADPNYVRRIFRDDIATYRAKAKVISEAEVYRDAYVISKYAGSDADSPTVIGAQAADELLNISGIKASFVLTEYDGRIFVSARAIEGVSVQLIMEKLDGGGHSTVAGAQFNHTDMQSAVAELKRVIGEMIDAGDL